MSPEEYKEKLKTIKKEYESDIVKLNKKFVLDNRKFNPGDIIQDEKDIIIIEKVLFYFKHDNEESVPSIAYSGKKLTMRGEERKDKKTEIIHEKVARKYNRKPINEK